MSPLVMSPKRTQNRANKTQLFLDTAMDIVERDGLEALSLHRLAREADCAVGGLYRYFASKDALLAELQCRVIRNYHSALSDRLTQALIAGCSPLLRLTLCAGHYQAYLIANPAHFRLLSQVASDPRELLSYDEGLKVMNEVQSILVRLGALITEACADHELTTGDTQRRALLFWSTVQGVVQLRKLERFAPELLDNVEMMNHALSTLLRGWGATEKNIHKCLLEAPEHLG